MVKGTYKCCPAFHVRPGRMTVTRMTSRETISIVQSLISAPPRLRWDRLI